MANPDIQALLQSAIEDTQRPHIEGKYSVVNGTYVNARTPVVLNCADHGEFEILPRDIQRRSYLCPECQAVLKGKKRESAPEVFVAKVEKRFPGRFDFSEMQYVDSQTPVTLICKKHRTKHSLYPFDIDKRTYICTDCRDEGLRQAFAPTAKEFVEKAQKVHGERYNYAHVEYRNASTKVVIACPEHGDFEQAPRSHLSGRGCPMCGKAAMAEKKSAKPNQIPKKGTRNEQHQRPG